MCRVVIETGHIPDEQRITALLKRCSRTGIDGVAGPVPIARQIAVPSCEAAMDRSWLTR